MQKRESPDFRYRSLEVGTFVMPLYSIDKTRQDNALFGVLYSPMYIDFIQII